jgi:hypothetical protein
MEVEKFSGMFVGSVTRTPHSYKVGSESCLAWVRSANVARPFLYTAHYYYLHFCTVKHSVAEPDLLVSEPEPAPTSA